MIERLKQLSRNQFLRNVSTLAFGTIISQAVVVGSSPILSRIYSVEQFGLLSVFTSITVFFAVVSTGRYELAIGLPDNDDKSAKIFKLIIAIGAVISSLYLAIILLLKHGLRINDHTGFLNQNTSYLAPLYIFFVATFSALGYWNQRHKNYKKITIANAVQVIATTLFSIALGLLGYPQGMIVSLIIGILVAVIYMFVTDLQLLPMIVKQRGLGEVAREYVSFPRYMILSDLSLTASQQFIPILFSVLYNPTIVGFFSMANRMLRLPNIVITQSIGNVFRNDAIDAIRNKGNCKDLYISTFKKLLFMSLPIYILIFLFSPFIFKLAFGARWEMAGNFARILSTMLFLEFIATPLNTLFYVREKQKILMRLQVANAILGAVMIYFGSYFFNSASVSLIFFCASAIVFNLVMLTVSYEISKKQVI